MDIVMQIGFNAVIAGSIYALVALGFSVVYSTARFFDLGYGALAALGAYALLSAVSAGVSLPLAVVVSVAVVSVVGVGIEWTVYRRLRARKASPTVFLVASLGVMTVVQACIAMVFGSQFQTIPLPAYLDGVYTIGGAVITHMQVYILVMSLACMSVIAYMLYATRFGMALRAVADDWDVAQIVGINSGRMSSIVFGIGAGVAALAGCAVALDTGMQPTMGLSLLLKGVVAAIIGGLGNPFGAVFGSFLLALIENVGVWYISGEWKDAIAFGILIIFLLIRPHGIFGKK